jgi:hypothetical protein
VVLEGGRAPRRVVLAGSVAEFDVVLDEGEAAQFCSSACAAFVRDAKTNERWSSATPPSSSARCARASSSAAACARPA